MLHSNPVTDVRMFDHSFDNILDVMNLVILKVIGCLL